MIVAATYPVMKMRWYQFSNSCPNDNIDEPAGGWAWLARREIMAFQLDLSFNKRVGGFFEAHKRSRRTIKR